VATTARLACLWHGIPNLCVAESFARTNFQICPTTPRPRRARTPSAAKRRPVNPSRVTAGGGRGEGDRAAHHCGVNRQDGESVAWVSQPVRRRNFCPDKFSNLSHDAAALRVRPLRVHSRNTVPLGRERPPPARSLEGFLNKPHTTYPANSATHPSQQSLQFGRTSWPDQPGVGTGGANPGLD
jgi:hypothetical protein